MMTSSGSDVSDGPIVHFFSGGRCEQLHAHRGNRSHRHLVNVVDGCPRNGEIEEDAAETGEDLAVKNSRGVEFHPATCTGYHINRIRQVASHSAGRVRDHDGRRRNGKAGWRRRFNVDVDEIHEVARHREIQDGSVWP